jgi:hypothetical protein
VEQYEAAYVGDLHINMKIAVHLPFKANKEVTIEWSAFKSLKRRLTQSSKDLVPMTAIEQLSPSGSHHRYD